MSEEFGACTHPAFDFSVRISMYDSLIAAGSLTELYVQGTSLSIVSRSSRLLNTSKSAVRFPEIASGSSGRFDLAHYDRSPALSPRKEQITFWENFRTAWRASREQEQAGCGEPPGPYPYKT